ncbi:Arc family DNA-binding protein [Azotobacter vinelandii]|uniref:Arc family DNA-binding protein n=1 Tax=Azotobacter vinelandii TaxID=354 RepID=UPI0026663672|nr:Arc family DNA-binding protein [Azotobacter vinelandii]WKN20801.1 Arc family DNA-binding protein [Azotobacter vinelandii]
MSRTDPQFNLRIPQELRDRVMAAAQANKRSATAEILARLEASFEPAHESSIVFDEQASPDSSYTSSAQLIGALTEVQAQMASLADKLRSAQERERQQAPESSGKE